MSNGRNQSKSKHLNHDVAASLLHRAIFWCPKCACVHTLRALARSPLLFPYFSHNTDAHTQITAAHAPTGPTPHAFAVAVAPSPSLSLSSGGMKGESTLWETLLHGRCSAGTMSPCGLTSKRGEGVTTWTIHTCRSRVLVICIGCLSAQALIHIIQLWWEPPIWLPNLHLVLCSVDP